ncbi:hypothetical protein COCCU_04705 [Corynebacterium occultum]|uniref:DUF4245 domain-containing protein n=1 Tax=Corynebacterium occultum TaxID=2675219 RepID=A0A6B8W4N0_9CORY|nr:DUF4245 domain-containing protein [Corynebacterium occultum]QGU06887.1 hypothetical protein COCCU_04705 [Corynebacterium occultum]
MADEKPKIFQGGKDMVLSVGVIVLVMFLMVGFTGMCSWNPGAPKQGPVQEVDAVTFASLEARTMNFPVRMPETPEGWVTNSARRSMVDDTPAVTIGWVTTEGGYLQLTQTGEELDDAVRGIDPDPRTLEETREIAGEEVQRYSSEESDVRDLWVVDLDEVRILLTGAGTDEEFSTLLDVAIEAEPLPSE